MVDTYDGISVGQTLTEEEIQRVNPRIYENSIGWNPNNGKLEYIKSDDDSNLSKSVRKVNTFKLENGIFNTATILGKLVKLSVMSFGDVHITTNNSTPVTIQEQLVITYGNGKYYIEKSIAINIISGYAIISYEEV